MKISAAILMATFMAFIVQTVKIPYACTETTNKNESAMCPMMAMHKTCTQQTDACCTQHSTTQNQKKGTETPSKCVDCPLCTILLQAPVNNFSCIISFTTSEYTLVIPNTLSDYFTRQWKPPNYRLLC